MKKMIKKELIKRLKIKGYKVLEWSCDLRKSNSLYYPNNFTVLILEKEGIKYNVESRGDIILAINKQNFDKTNEGLTRKEIQLLKNGKAELENNNWFEVLIFKKDDKIIHCELGNVVFDLQHIPELLK